MSYKSLCLCTCVCTRDLRLEAGRNALPHRGICVSQIIANGVKNDKNQHDAWSYFSIPHGAWRHKLFSSWAGKENSPSMKHYSTVERIYGCTKLFMASAIFFWERQNTWKHSPVLLLQFSKEIFSLAWKNSQSWICMCMWALGKPGEQSAFPRDPACRMSQRSCPLPVPTRSASQWVLAQTDGLLEVVWTNVPKHSALP